MKHHNRTIFERNNIDVLRVIDSVYIDLCYLNPSFDSN